jgi:hypothetical protein
MIDAGAVDRSELDALEAELELAAGDPAVEWEYHAVQVVAAPPT